MALPYSTNFPGPLNVYIPAFQGKQTANLIVSFARDPKKFAVNKMTQRTPTSTLAGNFMKLQPEMLARYISQPNAAIWVDGQPSPTGTHNQQDFRAIPYICQRIADTAYIGWQTRDQAVWDIQDTQLSALGHLMMTRRAAAFYALTMNTSNHIASHVKTANQWSAINGTGGFWSAGTSSNPIIDRSLKNVADAIRKSTMDATSYLDLSLVVTPTAAIGMSTSPEIHDYVARSQFAQAQVRGDAPNFNYQWGLPEKLYGFNLIVDGTLKTTTPRLTVPGTATDILSDNAALVIAMPGDLSANVGQLSSQFSSVHMFVYNGEEMMVETQDEPWNKRTNMRVSETYGMVFASNETAGIITNLFS